MKSGRNEIYNVIFFRDGLELQKLFLLLVVVVGPHKGDHKHSNEDCSPFNPTYSNVKNAEKRNQYIVETSKFKLTGCSFLVVLGKGHIEDN
jgi:hypothetical protein